MIVDGHGDVNVAVGRTLRVFEAAALEGLQQSLQNGSIWSSDSLRYREHESCLIPADEWHRSRARYLQDLGAPASVEDFLEKIEAAVQADLSSVAEAVESGELRRRRKPQSFAPSR